MTKKRRRCPDVFCIYQGGDQGGSRTGGFARQHPGETVSSWILKGAYEYLMAFNKEANYLRDNYIIKIIPMINVDGVICGNSRTSLSGCDLNRRWEKPDEFLHPEIYYLKELIFNFTKNIEVEYIIDFHGHFCAFNSFFYGKKKKKDLKYCKYFPFVVGKISDVILFNKSCFKMPRFKKGTGRIHLFHELGIENDLGNIGIIKTITKSLDKMIEEITLKESDPAQPDAVYDEIISEVNKRENNQIDYGFVNTNTKNNLNLSESLSQLNERIDSCNIEDTWSFNCEINQQGSCNSAINTSRCINPKSCIDELKSRYTSICLSTQNSINEIDKIFEITNFASDSTKTNSISNQALNVKNAYRTFLTSAKNALSTYTIKFRPFGEIYNNFVGNGSILGVINCAFIGKNVKVLLNYLNDTIGDGFITLGIVLVIDGFIILCNIAFTILLLAIIDEVARIRKEEMNNKTNSPDEDQGNVIPSANVDNVDVHVKQ